MAHGAAASGLDLLTVDDRLGVDAHAKAETTSTRSDARCRGSMKTDLC
jgi:hypothetical protein